MLSPAMETGVEGPCVCSFEGSPTIGSAISTRQSAEATKSDLPSLDKLLLTFYRVGTTLSANFSRNLLLLVQLR